ncbi:hypothetical protein [Candidatus Ichthyocystis hellenicum]|uniref:hypothetical protein n=1 Tax=Candidatus Ichthyocystis hellenicum TaxID=1561003 RepID=UPI000B8992E8|nr:hypothetical protein [Candidatus Ichthyocystis hellenicum]
MPRRGAPFYIDCSDEELIQSDEEIDVAGLSPLGDSVSQVDSAIANPVLTGTSILSFSKEVARFFLSNFSQENRIILVERLCANYGYSIFTADIHGCLGDEFFQEFALRNNYLLTDTFLARINQLRNEFSYNIDLVLNSKDFSRFLFRIDAENLGRLGTLTNIYSATFSRSSYRVRHHLVGVLISVVIPRLIKIIKQHTVIRGSDECILSYYDREQFFLHVVTTLERLIILKLMNYWNGFCSVNQDMLSLFTNVDFSNPFTLARDRSCSVRIPEVNSPVAFNFRYGIFISFMATDHLDEMVGDVVSDYICRLSPVVLGIVKKNYSALYHLKYLSRIKEETIGIIINEEFSKATDESLRNKFINFLNESLIWEREELSQDVLQNFVKKSIYKVRGLVREKITNEALGLIKEYKDNIIGMRKNKKTAVIQSGRDRSSFNGKCDISNACGFKVSERFFSTLDDIRSSSLAPFRSIARRVIYDTLKSGRLTRSDWASVSKNLLSDIIDASRSRTDIVYREMSSAISKARVISEGNVERGILPVERAVLHKHVMQLSNNRFRHNVHRLWKYMTKEHLESSEASSSGDAAGSSAASAVSSSRGESTQESSFLVTVEGKSKGKKRKRDVAASSEDRLNIVRSEYGSILVRREFNDEISSMVSEHLNYVDRVFEDIRGDLEEGNSCATDDELVENMRRQSSESSVNILAEFMDRVKELVSNTSVYGDDVKERVIHKNEVSSFMAQLNRVVTLRHAEILDKKLEELLIINVVD